MLNEVDVKIKLVRSKDAFCVMSALACKAQIVHASLERGTAKYPIRRVVCKSFTVLQNCLDVSHEKLFFGQFPTRTVIGLVSNRAFNGHLTSNQFNFQHFGLNEIALYLDGQQQHAVRPIQPNYETEQYITAYDSLFAGTGRQCRDEGLFISR